MGESPCRPALVLLALFLIVQVSDATGFGLLDARATSESLTDEARLIVNLDRLPSQERICEDYVEFIYQPNYTPSKLRAAAEDHLGEFLRVRTAITESWDRHHCSHHVRRRRMHRDRCDPCLPLTVSPNVG